MRQVLVKHLASLATGALAFPDGVVELIAPDDADRGEEAVGAAFEGDGWAWHKMKLFLAEKEIEPQARAKPCCKHGDAGEVGTASVQVVEAKTDVEEGKCGLDGDVGVSGDCHIGEVRYIRGWRWQGVWLSQSAPWRSGNTSRHARCR